MSEYSIDKKFKAWEAKAKLIGVYDEYKLLDKTEINNMLYGADKYNTKRVIVLKRYMGKQKKLVIPPVSEIAHDAFNFNRDIEEVVIEEGTDVLGKRAFANCANLKRVVIKGNIEIISRSCFKSCISLEEIVIPNSVKIIEGEAFSGCENLKHIKLPNKIEEIYDNAFEMTGLESIDLPKSLRFIGNRILDTCTYLRVINIKAKKLNVPYIVGNEFTLVSSHSPIENISVTKECYDTILNGLSNEHKTLVNIMER